MKVNKISRSPSPITPPSQQRKEPDYITCIPLAELETSVEEPHSRLKNPVQVSWQPQSYVFLWQPLFLFLEFQGRIPKQCVLLLCIQP